MFDGSDAVLTGSSSNVRAFAGILQRFEILLATEARSHLAVEFSIWFVSLETEFASRNLLTT